MAPPASLPTSPRATSSALPLFAGGPSLEDDMSFSGAWSRRPSSSGVAAASSAAAAAAAGAAARASEADWQREELQKLRQEVEQLNLRNGEVRAQIRAAKDASAASNVNVSALSLASTAAGGSSATTFRREWETDCRDLSSQLEALEQRYQRLSRERRDREGAPPRSRSASPLRRSIASASAARSPSPLRASFSPRRRAMLSSSAGCGGAGTASALLNSAPWPPAPSPRRLRGLSREPPPIAGVEALRVSRTSLALELTAMRERLDAVSGERQTRDSELARLRAEAESSWRRWSQEAEAARRVTGQAEARNEKLQAQRRELETAETAAHASVQSLKAQLTCARSSCDELLRKVASYHEGVRLRGLELGDAQEDAAAAVARARATLEGERIELAAIKAESAKRTEALRIASEAFAAERRTAAGPVSRFQDIARELATRAQALEAQVLEERLRGETLRREEGAAVEAGRLARWQQGAARSPAASRTPVAAVPLGSSASRSQSPGRRGANGRRVGSLPVARPLGFNRAGAFPKEHVAIAAVATSRRPCRRASRRKSPRYYCAGA
eukprot:TRINITY_DN6213_c0_g5_i1.p1 TRINITY_DN6213_c0_g5~~TRINITY_DN6213_c0_g5_i1.p1  ORF type:complete len:561 (+),score=134.90 TRINITY_DN6213_c0_g5_i1:166-1848(+)